MRERPAHQAPPDLTPEQRAAQHLAVTARRFAAGRANAIELDHAVHLWQRLRDDEPPLPPGQPVQPPRVGPGEAVPAEKPQEVIDLMEALKASLFGDKR